MQYAKIDNTLLGHHHMVKQRPQTEEEKRIMESIPYTSEV